MNTAKNKKINKQIEMLIGLLLSERELPEDLLESLQAWLIDENGEAAEKKAVLENCFDRMLRTGDDKQQYALASWPELAGKLGMDPRLAEHAVKRAQETVSKQGPVHPVPRKRLRQTRFVRYAAAAAVICLAAIPAFYLATQRGAEFSSVESIIASPSDTLRLPDGSKLLLRPNTTISYIDDFLRNRRVSINGEAFFSVLHDERYPFTVEGRDIKVTVTGTEFNMRAYDDENYAEVMLIAGSLTIASGGLNITLRSGERAAIDKNGNKIEVSTIGGGELMKARGAALVMEGVSLDEALSMVGGYFGVAMDIPSDLPATDGIVLDLDFNATLEDALFLLQAANPVFDYNIRESSVSITKR